MIKPPMMTFGNIQLNGTANSAQQSGIGLNQAKNHAVSRFRLMMRRVYTIPFSLHIRVDQNIKIGKSSLRVKMSSAFLLLFFSTKS